MKSLVSGFGVTYLTLILFSSLSTSSFLPRQSKNNLNNNKPWSVSNFHSLIAFGDSYTDESRLGWFINHNGSAPPAGTLLPESFSTPGGGRTWPRYVVQYTGSTTQKGQWDPQMTLYNYAVSGAVCSNDITPRYVFCPSVLLFLCPMSYLELPGPRSLFQLPPPNRGCPKY